MIETWVMDISPFLDREKYQEIFKTLPDFRKKKAEELNSDLNRAQSAGAYFLFMKMKEHFSIDPPEEGFNLSHSGKFATASLETDPSKYQGLYLGCDIEVQKEFREGVSRRFFTEKENLYLLSLPEEKRSEAFYNYWVMKESFIKATREGLKRSLKSFEIDLERPGLAVKPEEFKDDFFFMKGYIENAHIAVCSNDRIINPIKIYRGNDD